MLLRSTPTSVFRILEKFLSLWNPEKKEQILQNDAEKCDLEKLKLKKIAIDWLFYANNSKNTFF